MQAPKKLKETDAIFQQLSRVHQRAVQSEDTLRLSLDAKAPVLIGPFSRGGKSRLGTAGSDHDFKPWGRLTPFGLFLPDSKELNFYFTSSKVTSDFVLHPGMELTAEQRHRFLLGAAEIFAADTNFTHRLDACLPLYALRWTMILLNEYLPERWQRRLLAGFRDERSTVLRRQLDKANAMLAPLPSLPHLRRSEGR